MAASRPVQTVMMVRNTAAAERCHHSRRMRRDGTDPQRLSDRWSGPGCRQLRQDQVSSHHELRQATKYVAVTADQDAGYAVRFMIMKARSTAGYFSANRHSISSGDADPVE